MMRFNAPCDVMEKVELRKMRLAERQARVGIVANAVNVSLPAHPQRDVWTRWPKLRSARRMMLDGVDPGHPARLADPVLNGERLKDFTLEVRQSEPLTPKEHNVEVLFAPEPTLDPPFDRARLVIRLALGVLVVGLALVGLSLALR